MKIKLLLALPILLAATACSDGVFTTTTTNSLVAPDHNYEIDTWGANSEVYEFTPKSNKNKSCIFVMLDNGKAMGLQCFDKNLSKPSNKE